jgi:hypothetical protein
MNVPRLMIPVLTVAVLIGGYYLRLAFTQPTTSAVFEELGIEKIECTVEGLKCRGTANFFTRLFEGTSGISSIDTFASEHRAVFTYDPAKIKPEEIRRIMEQPVRLRDGSSRQVFRCVSME